MAGFRFRSPLVLDQPRRNLRRSQNRRQNSKLQFGCSDSQSSHNTLGRSLSLGSSIRSRFLTKSLQEVQHEVWHGRSRGRLHYLIKGNPDLPATGMTPQNFRSLIQKQECGLRTVTPLSRPWRSRRIPLLARNADSLSVAPRKQGYNRGLVKAHPPRYSARRPCETHGNLCSDPSRRKPKPVKWRPMAPSWRTPSLRHLLPPYCPRTVAQPRNQC